MTISYTYSQIFLTFIRICICIGYTRPSSCILLTESIIFDLCIGYIRHNIVRAEFMNLCFFCSILFFLFDDDLNFGIEH